MAQDAEGNFKKYTNHRRGTLAVKKADVDDDTTCLGEVATELEMVQREGVDSDDEGACEGDADDNEEESDD